MVARSGDAAERAREVVSDYAGFDFRGLWQGRDLVTEVERAILRRSLPPASERRVLEVGTGFGRLTPVLAAAADELVACDFDAAALAGAPLGPTRRGAPQRIAANVYHLPFVDGAFSAATMIRVHHHLERPTAALAELARVLRPPGRLVVSYNPRPSLGTLVGDVHRGVVREPGSKFRSLTFSREEWVRLDPNPFPIFSGTRAMFAESLRQSGLREDGELGSGVEEFWGLRVLPAGVFLGLANILGRSPGTPMRFASVSRAGAGAAAGALPPAEAILACPRCRTPMPGFAEGDTIRCAPCGFEGATANGVTDLRYVPPDSRVLRTRVA